jgi:hypothetical protein
MTVHCGSPASDWVRVPTSPRSHFPRAIRDPPCSRVIRPFRRRGDLSVCEGDFLLKCSESLEASADPRSLRNPGVRETPHQPQTCTAMDWERRPEFEERFDSLKCRLWRCLVNGWYDRLLASLKPVGVLALAGAGASIVGPTRVAASADGCRTTVARAIIGLVNEPSVRNRRKPSCHLQNQAVRAIRLAVS